VASAPGADPHGRNGLDRAYDVTVRRADALRLIEAHRAELKSFGVRSLALFGSVARDEARPDSDVDVLVEFAEPVGFFHVFRVRRRLEEILGTNVDLITPGGLRPELRNGILAEAVRAA
jgi:predicted nucleotidyltransferase